MKELKQILVSVAVLALAALAGAFMDVQNLKADVNSLSTILTDIQTRLIRIENHIMKE